MFVYRGEYDCLQILRAGFTGVCACACGIVWVCMCVEADAIRSDVCGVTGS